MRRVVFALGASLAFALGLLAIAARENLGASGFFAAVAVLVASVVLAFVAFPEAGEGSPGPSASVGGYTPWDQWIRGGDFGKEEIVRHLDRIDRMGYRPNLPMRTEKEMDEVRRLPHRGFLELVTRRLDEIEGPT